MGFSEVISKELQTQIVIVHNSSIPGAAGKLKTSSENFQSSKNKFNLISVKATKMLSNLFFFLLCVSEAVTALFFFSVFRY